jgi:PAS domain S-box-containing protein
MTPQQTLEFAEDESILRGERRILELIATGSKLQDVLIALCRLIDEPPGLKSAVYLLDRQGRNLVFSAGPHIPEAWIQATQVFPARPESTACGAAISCRGPVIAEDVQTSPFFDSERRAAAHASGITGAWSTPFFSADGQVLGTFALVSAGSWGALENQRRRVDRAAYLASIAVERHHAERDLRESEQRFSTAFYAGPACMSITRFADGRFLYVNDEFVSVFGYARNQVIGQTALQLNLWADPTQRDPMLEAMHAHRIAHAREAKARTASGTQLDMLFWAERIQILGEECVLGITCDISARKRTEQALAQSERLLRVVLDSLPVGVAVVNTAGDITLSNPASQEVWGKLITTGGDRWANSKAWWVDTGKRVTPEEWASVRALKRGETSVDEHLEIETFDGARKVIENSAVPIRDGGGQITGAVIVNSDISAREKAERELHESVAQMRTLTGRLMRAQDDERRRIAQMLHETTAQDLAALKMQLARLVRTEPGLSAENQSALHEGVELAERTMTTIRTLSYLLHPPFLDEIGLLSALRWYVEGFVERSGIKVELDLPEALARLPRDVEMALFRVVQEALMNVHRHASSANASIRLRVDACQLRLSVEDHGRGMSPDVLAQLPTGGRAIGVGVVGMRERLHQLGGMLDIESGERGTIVRATVPVTLNQS